MEREILKRAKGIQNFLQPDAIFRISKARKTARTMVQVGSSILFSTLWWRPFFTIGNDQMVISSRETPIGKKEMSVFQAACECLIRLRLQTKRKKHYAANCCAYIQLQCFNNTGGIKIMWKITVHKWFHTPIPEGRSLWPGTA